MLPLRNFNDLVELFSALTRALTASCDVSNASQTIMHHTSQRGLVLAVTQPVTRGTMAPACMHALAEREAKVWRLARTGNIGNLTLHDVAVPSAQSGEVVVAVKAVRPCSLLCC